MKFAAPYHHTQSSIPHSDIDEFNIKFTKDSKYEELEVFIQKHPEHRINAEFLEDEYDIDGIIELCQKYDTLYIRLKPKDLKYLRIFDDEAINYFFDSVMKIYSYGTLEWAFMYHPTDIYISDDLTYNMNEVYKQCNARNIQLRIILNRAPVINSAILSCPSAQIYRPQDFNFLDKYYTVGEFDCGEEYDWVKAEVWYRRWFIDHYWDDSLDYINLDIDTKYPTVLIPSELVHVRANCKHRCTMSEVNSCGKCSRMLRMGFNNANMLKQNESGYSLPSLETMINTIITSKDNNEN